MGTPRRPGIRECMSCSAHMSSWDWGPGHASASFSTSDRVKCGSVRFTRKPLYPGVSGQRAHKLDKSHV
ncbi:hypothetical protein A3768_1652 [Ralstonia solanacearum]|nr:hypothetical protein A3768_1652 [Ralstonia solanacearum]ARU23698.1 hypothetical protein RSSE_c3315 [Ralstonia solanacearum]